MDELIRTLKPDEALEVVRRLNAKGGDVAAAIRDEARSVFCDIDEDDIADDIFDKLDSIGMEEGLRNAGSTRHGYTDPAQAALEAVEEILQPFMEKALRYRSLRMLEQADVYTRGIVLGLYEYEQESTTDLKDWVEDVPLELAGELLRGWRAEDVESERTAIMADFIGQRCPEWADYKLVELR